MFCFVLFFRQDLTLYLCSQASLELTMCPGWPRLTSILLPQSHKITGLSNHAWPRKVISTAPHQLSKPSSIYRVGPVGSVNSLLGCFLVTGKWHWEHTHQTPWRQAAAFGCGCSSSWTWESSGNQTEAVLRWAWKLVSNSRAPGISR